MQPTKLVVTLRTLQESGVQFILVGGLAAVLNGAPIQTYVLMWFIPREPANIDRLLTALPLMNAIFRI